MQHLCTHQPAAPVLPSMLHRQNQVPVYPVFCIRANLDHGPNPILELLPSVFLHRVESACQFH